MNNAHQIWQKWTWRQRESFLKKHSFKPGWSAHEWNVLDRRIQAKLEIEKATL